LEQRSGAAAFGFFRMRASLLFCVLLLGAGCSMSAKDDASAPGAFGGSSSLGGTGGVGVGPSTLRFQMKPEMLQASEHLSLSVLADPPGSYHVRFSLPSSEGDPLDAVLDSAEAETNPANGIAMVGLTMPSSAATFQVRATIGTSLVATLTLEVEDPGTTAIQVTPRYINLSTIRNITTWAASAHVDKTCAQLSGIPPEDGPYPAPLAASNESPLIPNVPAGKTVAVVLRSGHFVGGCTSVASLPPSPVTAPQVVVVPLLNRPIDLSTSQLSLSLDVSDADTSFSTSLSQAGTQLLDALLGTSTDDVDALLDAMREASDGAKQALESARKAEDWDGILRARWGAGAETKLHDLVNGWLASGRQSFGQGGHLFVGALSPLTKLSDDAKSAAQLELQTVSGLNAARAGFTDAAQVSWAASADDTVVLSADLYFVRTQLAAALAENASHAQVPTVDDAPGALAQLLDCDGLAAALTAAGANAQLAYSDCDDACVARLCEQALLTLWHRGADAEGLTPTRLSLTASGKAYVGDNAEVAGLDGTWLGALSTNGAESKTGGPLTAATPTKK